GKLDNTACGDGCWSNYAQIVDFDGNGTLDLVFANCGGFFGLENPPQAPTPQPLVLYSGDGAGNFTNVSQAAVGGFVGPVREVAFGDIDGDGDIDMYAPSANGSQTGPVPDKLFINQGNGTFIDELAQRIPGLTSSTAGATRFGDVDNDGDLDLIVLN